MVRRALSALLASTVIAGCAATSLSFPNATPGKSLVVPAWEERPEGPGPFPAVVLLHGCHGVSESNHEWSRWFRDQGYVALIVDSWSPRGYGKTCDPKLPDIPNTDRFDDAVGALRLLQDRKSTRLNSSHGYISYAVFCLKKKKKREDKKNDRMY